MQFLTSTNNMKQYFVGKKDFLFTISIKSVYKTELGTWRSQL